MAQTGGLVCGLGRQFTQANVDCAVSRNRSSTTFKLQQLTTSFQDNSRFLVAGRRPQGSTETSEPSAMKTQSGCWDDRKDHFDP